MYNMASILYMYIDYWVLFVILEFTGYVFLPGTIPLKSVKKFEVSGFWLNCDG